MTKENRTYYVGRIKFTVAKKAHIKAAGITIDRNHITHISIQHADALRRHNMSTLEYVKMIIQNYTEIYRRPSDAILLVVKNDNNKHDTCTLELYLDNTIKEWRVKTAQIRRNEELLKIQKDLIWTKKGGNAT